MNTKNKIETVRRLAAGEIQQTIADDMGVSQGQISKIKRDNKELIQLETEKYIATLPEISEQIIRDIRTSDKLSKAMAGEIDVETLPKLLVEHAPKMMDLSYKKSADILRAMGILPSNAHNTYIQNILQDNSTNVISPSVQKILSGHLHDIIDVEVED